MTIPGGYIPLFRCFEESWQYSRPLWRSAWVTLLVMAAWDDMPAEGLKRGQLWLSVSQAARLWGMSDTAVRRFLRRAEVEKDILWERGKGGWHDNCKRAILLGSDGAGDGALVTPCDGACDGAVARITLLNYDHYRSLVQGGDGACDGAGDGANSTACDGVLKERRKELKEKKNKTPPAPKGEPPASNNSEIFDRFIRIRRQRINEMEWLPTKAMAVQMRKNIKEMLRLYDIHQLRDWLEGFFEDDYAAKANYPWGLFAKDPTAYKGKSDDWRVNR